MNVIFWISVPAACGLFLVGIYSWLCRLSEYSPSDVIAFLEKIDLEVLYGTFHPDAEDMLRRESPRDEFRQIQWKRFHLAIRYCNLMRANCRIFQGWARYVRKNSWNEISPRQQKTIVELRSSCMQCRLASAVIRLRLRWWLLRTSALPWLAPPSFRKLLRVGSADMISFYDKVRSTAEDFSLAYGDEYRQKLVAAL